MNAQAPASSSSAPLRCSSCDSELRSPLACGACNTIFPVGDGLSHFERLGLAEAFDIDLQDAQRTFLELTRELHPDFFTNRPEEERALSLEYSAQLNEAWAVLQDPFRRAAYLLKLWAPQEAAERDNTMPDGFLEEMLFLREEIDELAEDEPSPERDAQLDQLAAQLQDRREQLVVDLREGFQALEPVRNDSEAATAPATTIRALLNASRYITNALEAARNAQA